MIPSWIADVDKVLVPAAVSVSGKATIRFFVCSAYKGQALCQASGRPIFSAESPHSGSPRVSAEPSLQHHQKGGLESVKCVCKKETRLGAQDREMVARNGLTIRAGDSEGVG